MSSISAASNTAPTSTASARNVTVTQWAGVTVPVRDEPARAVLADRVGTRITDARQAHEREGHERFSHPFRRGDVMGWEVSPKSYTTGTFDEPHHDNPGRATSSETATPSARAWRIVS